MQPGVFQDPGCVMCAALLKINPAMVMYCLHTPIHFCPSFTRPVVHFWSIFVRQMETKVSRGRINAAAFTYFHFHMIYITVKLWYIFGPQETKILH